MRHLIVSQLQIKIITSFTGSEESNPLQRICLNQEGRASSANKISLTNLPILLLTLSMLSCFESKVGEGFRFIDLSFLIEQLRRVCCTCKTIPSLKP